METEMPRHMDMVVGWGCVDRVNQDQVSLPWGGNEEPEGGPSGPSHLGTVEVGGSFSVP